MRVTHRVSCVWRAAIGCMLLLFFAGAANAVTYTTLNNGNWSDPCVWNPGPMGGPCPGAVPGTVNVNAGDTINIRHVVVFNLGTNINNFGTIRVEPFIGGGPAWLKIPTNIKVDNFVGGQMYVINARLLQCRFVSCDDGEPYSGTNPDVDKQDGVWTNKGGYVEIRGSVVEVAQKWINESNGTRRIIDSCVFTGQDFQVTDSTEEITRSNISIAWHGSGNFQVSGSSTITYNAAVIQIAGASGNFQQSSSATHSGDIDYIYLRNQIGNFTGSGVIMNDMGMPGGPVTLDAYCAQSTSQYIPNGEFTLAAGTPPNCGIAVACGAIVITAANVSVDGRVTTSDGRGIGGVALTVIGGSLDVPVLSLTNPFGYYSFPELEVGHTYLIQVSSKQYQFANPTRVITLNDTLTDVNFVADEMPLFTAPSVKKARLP